MRALIGPLSRVALVAVAVILIAGCVAAPAGAEQRPEAKEANDFIDFCFRAGGNPVVHPHPDDGSYVVVCEDLPGVGDYSCLFAGNERTCFYEAPKDPGGVRPNQPVDGVFVEEAAAPLLVARGSSSRVIVLGGSVAPPADEPAGSRVTFGESTLDPATMPKPASDVDEGTLPVEDTDAPVTTELFAGQGTLPVEESDAPVTTELFPGEGTLPVKETDAPVTTETWEGTLPVEETDAPVTTEVLPGVGTLPVEPTDAPVTTQPAPADVGILPVEETDAPITTEPAPEADEQP